MTIEITNATPSVSVGGAATIEVTSPGPKGDTGTGADTFNTVTADSGTNPAASGNDTLNIVGGEGIDTSGDSGTDTITITGEDASATNKGIVELATTAETTTGTSTTLVPPVSALPIQIQDSKWTFAADAEVSDTYVITLAPAPASYATGQKFSFTANTANTGAATLNVNSLGAVTIKKHHDQDLATGDIEAGSVVDVVYDGTNFQMTSQIGNAPAGSQNVFETVAGDAGTNPVADATNDTLTIAGTAGVITTTGDSATDTITISIDANGIDDTHIDWGTGAGQVSAVDVPIADSGAIITATEVEGALAENRTALDLNTTHRSSNGSDHTFIDQSVVSGASPTFDAANITGVGLASLDTDLGDTTDFYAGACLDTPAVTVASNGTTITLSVEKSGGGDIRVFFTTGVYTWDTTPADTVTLNAGTDAAPQINYVYFLESTKTLTASTSAFPSAEHAPIATVLCQSAASLQTKGAMKVHVWTDHITGADEGHLAHVNRWIRLQPATWTSGVALTPSITTNGGAEDNVDIATTAGVILQLHDHTYPAFNTGTGSEVYVVNHNTAAYTIITDLQDADEDDAGNAISNNDWTNLVIWGVVSEDTADCKLMLNFPSGFHNSATAATQDAEGYSNYTIPAEYTGTGFLIARLTLKYTTAASGTWSVEENLDLRGALVAGFGGSGTAQTEFSDGVFRLQDNADPTKELAFEVSNITTATTRTITVPDADIDLPGSGLAVAYGGTGQTSYTNGQLLIGNTTGNTLTKATLTAGTGIDITNGAGGITINAENANTSNAGILETATSAEGVAGASVAAAMTPAVTAEMVQDGNWVFAADAEVSDTYVITLTPAPDGYLTGQVFYFTANTANTGAATLNVNSLGAVTIKKHHDQDLATGDIEAGAAVGVFYDGTNFQMLTQVGNAPGGSQNLFETIAGDGGTNPVADATNDTLTIAGGTGISTSGDSGTDTITINADTASATVSGVVELATTAETTTGTDATRAVTPDGLKDGYQGSTNVVTLGEVTTSTAKETMWIPAAAMRPTVSNGCAALTDVETTAARPDMTVLDFDASADEHAQFQVAFPKRWNESTITFQVFWTTAGAVTTGVAWGLQGVAVGDNETIDQVYGTAIVVTDDAQSAAEEVYVTSESSAVTIANTPAVDNVCYFRIFRDVSDANDDMTQDARLIGVKLFYNTNAMTDT